MKKSGTMLMIAALMGGMTGLKNSGVMAPELGSQQQPMGRSGFPTPKTNGSVKRHKREMQKIKSRKKSKR